MLTWTTYCMSGLACGIFVIGWRTSFPKLKGEREILKGMRRGGYKSIDRESSTSCCGGEVLSRQGLRDGSPWTWGPGAAVARDEIWSNQKTEGPTARQAFRHPRPKPTSARNSPIGEFDQETALAMAGKGVTSLTEAVRALGIRSAPRRTALPVGCSLSFLNEKRSN